MLRLIALALLTANLGFYSWSHGWLAPLGFAPTVEGEPQRLTRQLRPEAMRLLSTDDVRLIETAETLPGNPAAGPSLAASAASAAAASTECLQAGVFTEAQAALLRTGLQASLPPGSWTWTPAVEPGRWLVYLGRFNNDEAMAVKRGELTKLGVPMQVLGSAPGSALSLGSFSSQANADSALASLAARGVRGARVVQDKPEVRGELLTLPVVDAQLKPRLQALKPQLGDKVLQSCR